jgi:hypothetical protein
MCFPKRKNSKRILTDMRTLHSQCSRGRFITRPVIDILHENCTLRSQQLMLEHLKAHHSMETLSKIIDTLLQVVKLTQQPRSGEGICTETVYIYILRVATDLVVSLAIKIALVAIFLQKEITRKDMEGSTLQTYLPIVHGHASKEGSRKTPKPGLRFVHVYVPFSSGREV